MTYYVDEKTGRGPYRKKGNSGQPNILMISFDMVPREFYLPLKGDLVPRTPNIDKLKGDGLFFSNAYAVSPLCSPSRAALFTGRYSYIVANNERSHDGQEMHIRENDTIFPEYLRSAGYRTRHFGKCHVGAHKYLAAFGENDAPWDRWSPPWYDDDGYLEMLRSLNADRFKFIREIRGMPLSPGGRGNFLGGWVSTEDGKPFPKEGSYPYYTTNLALAELRRHKSGKPFYLQLDYFEPHQPFFIPSGYEEREKELREELSASGFIAHNSTRGNAADSGRGEPLIYARYRRYWGIYDKRTMEDYLVANVLQYEILDEQIGRILGCLEEELYDDTLIALVSDHGEMNCRDGLIDKGAFLNPRVLQVPIYLKLPAFSPAGGSGRRGTVCDSLRSLLDLAPTILDAAGIEALDRFDGESLLNGGTNEGIKDGTCGETNEGKGNRKLMAEVFSHVLPNPAACLLREGGGETEMYTINFSDCVDEYFRRLRDGSWARAFSCPDDILKDMLAFFDADARWASYASYLRVIHPHIDGSSGDLTKFVVS